MSAFAAENIESLLASAGYNASITAFLAGENSVVLYAKCNGDGPKTFDARVLNHSALNLVYSWLFRFCLR